MRNANLRYMTPGLSEQKRPHNLRCMDDEKPTYED